MGYGKGSGAVGGSKKWKCFGCGKNTWSKSQEEWPSSKVGKILRCNTLLNMFIHLIYVNINPFDLPPCLHTTGGKIFK